MIDYIKGILSELTPTLAVVEAAGVGYAINITLPAYSLLVGKEQQECRLYTTEIIREDTHDLFGFPSKGERALFDMLMTVSGIGANTARMILSAMSPAELCNVISSGNEKMLKTVKGIGLRTAQRIIVDLRDKIAVEGVADQMPAAGVAAASAMDNEVRDEAIGALTMLGFSPAPSAKVVSAILTDNPQLPVEQVVKLALKQIK